MLANTGHEQLIGSPPAVVELGSRRGRRFATLICVYHVELRQFPHNFCRFNLTEGELREAVLEAWARQEWLEFGERKWNPHQAQLTVIQGPQLPLEQLSMGRGWRAATREGRDVTQQMLAAARADMATSEASGSDLDAMSIGGTQARANTVHHGGAIDTSTAWTSKSDVGPLADSLGLEVLAKLGDEAVPLAIVWQLACERHPEWVASESLRLAEHAVRSLCGSQLAVVLLASDSDEPEICASKEQIDAALHQIHNWSSIASSATALIRRA
jgi:hypothetical protein